MERDARQVVRTCPTYPEAQAAADTLADKGFPVERLSIVGEELRFVEDITGRRGYGAAAGQSLLAGAVVGALAGYFLGLFSLVEPLASALALASAGLLFGVLVGAVFGVAAHWATEGRRDFSSRSGMQAGRYQLMADPEVAEDAVRALDDEGAPRVAARAGSSR